MRTVNRTAIMVAPKEPYYAWAPALEPDSPIDEQMVDELSQVYLVDEPGDGEDFENLLRRHYVSIFERQLYQWVRSEKV
jgi:hypothetical protein